MKFFDILHNNAILDPDKIIWEDELYGEYSYKYIDEASSRICSYLMEQNIGTEDVVAVFMKRSARIFLVMLGTLKAGAAFTIIGEGSPDNIVDHILSETEPVMVFDDSCFDPAMNYDVCDEYCQPDPHDLACIIYSSGSSGVFKGAMHEYGMVDIATDLNAGWDYGIDERRNIFLGRFYTVSSVVILLTSIICHYYYYILPLNKLGKDEDIIGLIPDKRITSISASPTLLKLLNGSVPEQLKLIYTSFDILAGDFDFKIPVYNVYGMTETFGDICSHQIFKESGLVPVGKPYKGVNMMIVDQEDNVLGSGRVGEICVHLDYFRGYRNRPELTGERCRNGLYYTDDIGYINSDDDYVVLGRRIDLVETDQGYIVPAIISAEIIKCFPEIGKVYIKLFKNDEQIKVCVYYQSDEEITLGEFNQKLTGHIPNFMLPTHCIRVDKMAYLPNGKINRLVFPEPE